MRRTIAACFCAILTACDGSVAQMDAGPDAPDLPDPPRANVSWRVHCGSGTCPAEDPPARTIDAANGEDGHEVSCDLTVDGSMRQMRFLARLGDRYGIEVRGAEIGLEGGRIMGSFCRMRIWEEDDVTLFGPCSSNLSTADIPCQIQQIDIRDDDTGGPTQVLFAQFRCVNVEAEGDKANLRNVSAATAEAGYGELELRGCEGLRP
jgi:hypothetical protein